MRQNDSLSLLMIIAKMTPYIAVALLKESPAPLYASSRHQPLLLSIDVEIAILAAEPRPTSERTPAKTY